MSIFKDETEYKRVIFNIDIELAVRLEQAKKDSRRFNKKLDIETPINIALEKFLRKAEKKLAEMKHKYPSPKNLELEDSEQADTECLENGFEDAIDPDGITDI